jgi:hypothetical protein
MDAIAACDMLDEKSTGLYLMSFYNILTSALAHSWYLHEYSLSNCDITTQINGCDHGFGILKIIIYRFLNSVALQEYKSFYSE